jgi:hypothetical protein
MLKFQEIIDKIDQLEEANILLAALEFRIFTHLGNAGLTASALARKAKAQAEPMERLLNCQGRTKNVPAWRSKSVPLGVKKNGF